ncbi:hypothetical protein FJZ53_00400 [Candidatus Woesearchaeota archaeon]|nr:hypothetical protein [Candidatus Woesearchaeota archaeon]
MIGIDAKPMSLPTLRIEKDGVYDMSKMYKRLREWFEENNYKYVEKENTTNKKEKGTEVKLCMIGERMVTDYFKFELEARFLIIELQKVRVKDKDLDKGKLGAFVKATMYYDYKKVWSKNKFSKLLRFIYNNFIIKKKIDDVYSVALKFEQEDLFNSLKEALELYNA